MDDVLRATSPDTALDLRSAPFLFAWQSMPELRPLVEEGCTRPGDAEKVREKKKTRKSGFVKPYCINHVFRHAHYCTVAMALSKPWIWPPRILSVPSMRSPIWRLPTLVQPLCN